MSKLFHRTLDAITVRSPRREPSLGWVRKQGRLERNQWFGRVPVHIARPTPVPTVSIKRQVKRIIDVVLAAISLIVLSPLVVLVAAAIWLDSRGPIFRREMVYGYSDHPIRALKFRSTESDTDSAQSRWRVTRVGRVLRHSGIDELPQLINVLLGEMSIVGPCAYACQRDVLSHQFMQSLKGFKPGLTGWAQLVEARDGVISAEQRIAGDLHYANNWSLLLDFKILLRTYLSQKLWRHPESESLIN